MTEGNPEPGMGTVSGRVLDSTGTPFPDAWVHAFEEGPRWLTDLHLLGGCISDDEGRYRFEVTPGPVLLVASCDSLFRPEPSEVAHGTRIRVPEAGPAVETDLRIPYAVRDLGRVEGRVVDAAGRGIAEIFVTLDGVSLRSGVRRILTTDAEGRFALDGIFPGHRTIEVAGDRTRFGNTASLVLEPGATAAPVVTLVARPRAGTLRLRVRCVEEGGAPLRAVRILLDASPTFREEFATGADGGVLIEGLPDEFADEGLHLSAWLAEFEVASRRVSSHKETWPEEVTLTLQRRSVEESSPSQGTRRFSARDASSEPDAAVSGRVVDAAGVPMAGATVTWSRSPDSEKGWSLDVHQMGTTDSAGRFLVRGLPGGAARIAADLLGASNLACCPGPLPAAEVVLVPGEVVGGIELRLPFAMADLAVIECRVVDDEGEPREGLSVTADRGCGWLHSGSGCSTDANGVLQIRVFPGTVDVHAWETGTHEGVHATVVAAAGTRERVELRTRRRTDPRSLSLRVRVVDQDGAPVPGAEVHMSNEEGGLGEGVAGPDGVCEFPALHDSVRLRELHLSAYADGFFIGTPGASIRAWPEGKPAEAEIVLRRSIPFRVRVVDDRTGGAVPFAQLEIRGVFLQCLGGVYGGADDEGNIECGLPGPLLLRAEAPGYDLVEFGAELSYGEPEPRFELRLKRSGA